MNFTPEDFKRFYWHSRRGMLELDLLLLPFVEDHLQQLPEQDILLYREFLLEEDQDLYTWLSRRQPAPSAELQKMVDMILAANARAGASARANQPG